MILSNTCPLQILLLAFLISTNIPTCIWAFPTGAGQCPGAKPAVGGPHIQKTGYDESRDLDLSDAPQNFVLKIGGQVVTEQKTLSFAINQAHSLELTSESPFKGFLIRLGPQPFEAELAYDFTESLTSNNPNAQVLDFCTNEGVGGVTHTSADEKTKLTGIVLEMDEPKDDLILDVTVVIINSGQASEFYHSTFSLNAVDPDAEEESNETVLSRGTRQKSNDLVMATLAFGLGLLLVFL